MRVSPRLRALFACVLLALFAAACGDDDSSSSEPDPSTPQSQDETTEAPKSGGVITMGTYSEPSGLDPVVAQGGGTSGNSEMAAIYGTLMRYDAESQTYEPYMAESLEPNDDYTEWTLKLRPGVTFSDGTPYDAEAVVFGLKRHIQHGSSVASLVANIAEYEVVDETTVKFTLQSSWPNFPYILANSPGMIPSMAAVQAACPDPEAPARECDFNLKPVGAGPFVVASFTPKDSIVLERNETYWDGPVPLDGLRFVTLRGAQLTYESVKSGELQVGFLREAAATTAAKEDSSLDTYTVTQAMGAVVLINNGQVYCKGGQPANACAGQPDGVVQIDKPTADVRVRQAIAAATDPRQLDLRRNDGKGKPGTEIFQDGPLAGEPTSEYDPDRAKQLVAEAKEELGWDGSISVTCLQEQPSGQAFVQTMEALLNSVGFKVNTDLRPSTEYIQRVQLTRDFDVACWGFNLAPEAPEAGLSRHVLSVAGGNAGGNAMNLNNPDIDAAIVKVREAEDVEAKKEALDELAELWREEMPAVIYDALDETIAFSKKVKGLRFNVATTVLFDKAWLDQ